MDPIKLKIGILDDMNNIFRNTVFHISLDVLLKSFLKAEAYLEPKQSSMMEFFVNMLNGLPFLQ